MEWLQDQHNILTSITDKVIGKTGDASKLLTRVDKLLKEDVSNRDRISELETYISTQPASTSRISEGLLESVPLHLHVLPLESKDMSILRKRGEFLSSDGKL